jgi:hypothetical protein
VLQDLALIDHCPEVFLDGRVKIFLAAAALAKAEAEFKRNAQSFGLKPEQFGAEFRLLAAISGAEALADRLRLDIVPGAGPLYTDGNAFEVSLIR